MNQPSTFTCVQCGHLLPAAHRSHRKHKASWVCKTCADVALQNTKGEAERNVQRASVASQAARSARSLLEDRMAERELMGSFAEIWD